MICTAIMQCCSTKYRLICRAPLSCLQANWDHVGYFSLFTWSSLFLSPLFRFYSEQQRYALLNNIPNNYRTTRNLFSPGARPKISQLGPTSPAFYFMQYVIILDFSPNTIVLTRCIRQKNHLTLVAVIE